MEYKIYKYSIPIPQKPEKIPQESHIYHSQARFLIDIKISHLNFSDLIRNFEPFKLIKNPFIFFILKDVEKSLKSICLNWTYKKKSHKTWTLNLSYKL